MYKKKKKLKRAGIYIGAVILVVWSVLPVLWMFLSSITPSNEIIDASILLPKHVTLDRYKMILWGEQIEGVNRNAAAQSAVFRQAMVNSTIVAVVTSVSSSARHLHMRLRDCGSKGTVLCGSQHCFSSFCRRSHC